MAIFAEVTENECISEMSTYIVDLIQGWAEVSKQISRSTISVLISPQNIIVVEKWYSRPSCTNPVHWVDFTSITN